MQARHTHASCVTAAAVTQASWWLEALKERTTPIITTKYTKPYDVFGHAAHQSTFGRTPARTPHKVHLLQPVAQQHQCTPRLVPGLQ